MRSAEAAFLRVTTVRNCVVIDGKGSLNVLLQHEA